MTERTEKGRFKPLSGINDLTGKVFGKLTVKKMAPKTQRKTFWFCECECGNAKMVRSDSLIGGKTTSCGCVKAEQDRTNLVANHRHKMSRTRLYSIWQGIMKRCYSDKDKRYPRYGGRGIVVCEEWQKVDNFLKWAMGNGYSDNLTIERIDNNGNYEPSNCTWVTNKVQANNRRSNVLLTYKGKTQNIRQWCDELEMSYGLVYSRYSRNMPVEKIFHKGDLR